MNTETKKPKRATPKPSPDQSVFKRGRQRFGAWMDRPLANDGGDHDDCA